MNKDKQMERVYQTLRKIIEKIEQEYGYAAADIAETAAYNKFIYNCEDDASPYQIWRYCSKIAMNVKYGGISRPYPFGQLSKKRLLQAKPVVPLQTSDKRWIGIVLHGQSVERLCRITGLSRRTIQRLRKKYPVG